VKPIDPTLAADAVQAVTGPRQRDYAHPRVNFQRIADLWSPIFGVPVTPQQVAMAMIQVKISREMNRHTRDNLIDLIGYALTLDACTDEEER
jgi:hypothetical protein